MSLCGHIDICHHCESNLMVLLGDWWSVICIARQSSMRNLQSHRNSSATDVTRLNLFRREYDFWRQEELLFSWISCRMVCNSLVGGRSVAVLVEMCSCFLIACTSSFMICLYSPKLTKSFWWNHTGVLALCNVWIRHEKISFYVYGLGR